jgi:amino acid transporter
MPETGHTVAQTELKPGALGLGGVLMQSVTSIAPAIAGMFTIPFIASNAGVAAPLAYFGAFVIALMLGRVLTLFVRHMTSAGSYHTFVTRSLGAKPGFLVAWVYFLFYPVVIAQVGSFMGDTLEGTLKSEYGWNWFHWWYFMVFLIVFVAWTAYRGIELSTKVLITLGLFETAVVLALAINGFANPGPGGVTLDWINPGNAPSGHGLFLGVVFAIFAITGWDAAAPIAEESHDPKRNVTRGVLGSIILLGAFLVIVSWGQLSGWGTDHLDKFASSSELPAFVLGHRFWHGAWIIVLLALFNSALAVSIACMNASTRIFFSMGRAGVLPRSLAVLHSRYRTPTNAILLQTVINVVLGLGLAIAIGQANVYNVTGTMFTFALIPVYIVANIGVYFYYRREWPQEFSVFSMVIIPIVSSIALILVGWYSLNPLPDYPVSLAAPIVAGWLVVGAIVLVVMLSRGRGDWLARAGTSVAEVEETPDSKEPRTALV